MDLGSRYNGFSLSEPSATVASAIERIGQAVDTTYIATEELSASLNANFAEPMRESAQFAGVVRNVLRYRVLKRVQQEMTRDELEKKKALLDSLERSELEARRLDQYLSNSMVHHSPPKRSASNAEKVERKQHLLTRISPQPMKGHLLLQQHKGHRNGNPQSHLIRRLRVGTLSRIAYLGVSVMQFTALLMLIRRGHEEIRSVRAKKAFFRYVTSTWSWTQTNGSLVGASLGSV